jgi:hypothetical protein
MRLFLEVALRPLLFLEGVLFADLGRIVSRECGVALDRHCEERSDEEIQCSMWGPWIASLMLATTMWMDVRKLNQKITV